MKGNGEYGVNCVLCGGMGVRGWWITKRGEGEGSTYSGVHSETNSELAGDLVIGEAVIPAGRDALVSGEVAMGVALGGVFGTSLDTSVATEAAGELALELGNRARIASDHVRVTEGNLLGERGGGGGGCRGEGGGGIG